MEDFFHPAFFHPLSSFIFHTFVNKKPLYQKHTTTPTKIFETFGTDRVRYIFQIF